MGALIHDVAVIGAGVVGAAIARELTRHELTVLLIEAGPDVGAGTSKANTAILHTGYDARPGSLEARLVRRGHELLLRDAPSLGIAIEPTGAILVAWSDEELAQLPAIRDKAARNGITDLVTLSAAELTAREPHLAPGARGGLYIPGEGILCPYTPPLAYATEAIANGATLLLDSPVTAIRETPVAHELTAGSHHLRARWVVNAAGLHSDDIDALYGHARFRVTPRRGELIAYDKAARALLTHILLPIPTRATKGVLVAPTVYGNVLLGPTAEDLDDKFDTSTTGAGLAGLVARGRAILPALVDEEVTATYAGLRAATADGDYQLRLDAPRRYVCAGGIRSTGLSASLAIAEHVVGMLGEAGLPLRRRRTAWRSVRLPNLGEATPRPYQQPERIAADGAYGRIVCHCERVTSGEIRDALAAPIPARSLDGLRRRTRCLQGRCQGFHCLANVVTLVADATGLSAETILGLAPTGRDD